VGILEDIDKPLDEVENVLIRRMVIVVLGIPVFVGFVVGCTIGGTIEGMRLFWTNWIKPCW